MEFGTYCRRPFIVDAVEITEENIEELAPLIGTLGHKDDGTPFILVNRKLVPHINRVFPGFWLTKMDGRIHCYSRPAFDSQFVVTNDTIIGWVDYMKPIDEIKDKPVADDLEELPQPHNVFDGDEEDQGKPTEGESETHIRSPEQMREAHKFA